MAASYSREEIRAALSESDPQFSNYLDMETGKVIRVPDTDPSAEADELRNRVMDGYGDRYRYIPGGNPAAADADVQTWMEAEGL